MTASLTADSLTIEQVNVGNVLPTVEIDVTTTFVVTSAIATRDFMKVHHDRDEAHRQGSPDVFPNKATDGGLVVRMLTDWAGPKARLKRLTFALKVQNCVGEHLTVAGTVKDKDPEQRLVTLDVRSYNSLGDHLVGTAVLELPAGQ
jgi:hypothetical protein